MTKPLYKSKIFWTALIPMLIDIINLFLDSPIVPLQYRGGLSMASGVLIIVFRYYSDTPIKRPLSDD